MSGTSKEELYQRLAQARRLSDEPVDELTMERLQALIAEIERELAEACDADGQNSPGVVLAPNGSAGRG